MIGQSSLSSAGVSHSASTPFTWFAAFRRWNSRTSVQGLREANDTALAQQHVEIQRGLQAFPELQRELVDPGARVPEVVAPDDRGVAAHVPEAQPAALDDRDIGDAVVLREVVGRRETMATGAHDDGVVCRPRCRRTPEEVRRSGRSGIAGGAGHARNGSCAKGQTRSAARLSSPRARLRRGRAAARSRSATRGGSSSDCPVWAGCPAGWTARRRRHAP